MNESHQFDPGAEGQLLAGTTVVHRVADPTARHALERLSRSGVTIVGCERLSDLDRAARTHRPSIVVMEVLGEPHADIATTVQAARRAAPTAYVIGLVSYARSSGSDIAAIGRTGLDAMSLREAGTLASDLAAAVRIAGRSHELARLSAEIGLVDLLHPEAARLVSVAIAASDWPNVALVARRVGRSPRELQRRFAMAGLGVPHDLLQLSRWLLGHAGLRSADASRRRVATVLGFSSAGAMRDALRRSLDLPIGELGSRDAGELLRRRLRDEFGRRG